MAMACVRVRGSAGTAHADVGTPVWVWALWPHSRDSGAVASLVLASSPRMEMGQLLGHIKLSPPGCEQQQVLGGEGDLQLLFCLLNATKRV